MIRMISIPIIYEYNVGFSSMNGCRIAPQRFKQVLYRMEQAAAWPDAVSDDGRIERFHHKGVVIEDLGHSNRNACLQSLPVG